MTYPPHNITAAHSKGTTQLRVSLLAVWLTKFGEAHKDDPHLMALYHLISPALTACMESCGAGSKQRQSAAVLHAALPWLIDNLQAELKALDAKEQNDD